MKTLNRTIVSAMLISTDDKILLGKVREGGVYPDCWHIPGGGVDKGETKEQALVREIKEEVGLDISGYLTKLVRDIDTGEATKTDKDTGEQFHVIMQFNVYQVDIPMPSTEVKISLHDDLTEYKWVELDNLSQYRHTPPSQRLFSALGYTK